MMQLEFTRHVSNAKARRDWRVPQRGASRSVHAVLCTPSAILSSSLCVSAFQIHRTDCNVRAESCTDCILSFELWPLLFELPGHAPRTARPQALHRKPLAPCEAAAAEIHRGAERERHPADERRRLAAHAREQRSLLPHRGRAGGDAARHFPRRRRREAARGALRPRAERAERTLGRPQAEQGRGAEAHWHQGREVDAGFLADISQARVRGGAHFPEHERAQARDRRGGDARRPLRARGAAPLPGARSAPPRAAHAPAPAREK